MTATFDTKDDPELTAHLAAGRRAAVYTLVEAARSLPDFDYTGVPPEQTKADGSIVLFGRHEVGKAIDAAVIETMVRLQHPDAMPKPRRRWWRFWR